MSNDDLAKSMQHSVNNKFGAGEYEVLEPLKRGGDGYVYKAKIRKTNQFIALKALPKSQINYKLNATNSEKQYSACADLTKKAKNQIRIHQCIKSHFIVKLLQWFEDQYNYYLMLQYYPRGDLTLLVKDHKQGLPVQTVRSMGCQIAKGISVIHRLGIIHRDIKPNNILVGKNDEIKICDFSCSFKMKDKLKIKGAVGTLQYMAPEIIKSYNQKVDVWSFGCLLYYLAKGHSPFKMQKNDLTELHKAVNDKAIQNLVYPQNFPQSFKNLLKRIFIINPEQRINLQEVIAHPFLLGKDQLITEMQAAKLANKQNSRISQSMDNLRTAVNKQNKQKMTKLSVYQEKYDKHEQQIENINPNIMRTSGQIKNSNQLKMTLKNQQILNRKLLNKNALVSSVSEQLDQVNKRNERNQKGKSNLSPLNCEGIVYHSVQGEDDCQEIVINQNGFHKRYLKSGKSFEISPRGKHIKLCTVDKPAKTYTLEQLPERHHNLYDKFKQIVDDIRKNRISRQSRKKLLHTDQFSHTDRQSLKNLHSHTSNKKEKLPISTTPTISSVPNYKSSFQIDLPNLTLSINYHTILSLKDKNQNAPKLMIQIKEKGTDHILKTITVDNCSTSKQSHEKFVNLYQKQLYKFLDRYYECRTDKKLREQYYQQYYGAVQQVFIFISMIGRNNSSGNKRDKKSYGQVLKV